jgi:site-specific DNA recombinase
VPLGYVSRNKKPFIEEDEAERVRMIFLRYLELGSLRQLLGELRLRGIVTRRLCDGRTVGGIPFTRGPLAYLPRNRFYIGEVSSRARSAQGSIRRSSIVSCSTASSESLRNNTVRTGSEALLRAKPESG